MLPKKTLAWIAGAAAAVTLAACGTGAPTKPSGAASGGKAGPSPSASVLAGGASCSSSATQLTFWAWVPGINRAVNEYNKTHPGVCVTLEDPGAGEPEYT